MLTELTYYSPDRAAGIARGAGVWERVGGRARRARSGSARRGGGTIRRTRCGARRWRARGAIRARAIRRRSATTSSAARGPERREAIAAELDGRPPPVADGGVADAGDAGSIDGSVDGGAGG
jgi:hypothetical protein